MEGRQTQGNFLTPSLVQTAGKLPPSYSHRHSTISSTAASGRSKLGFQVPKLPLRWEHPGAEKEGFWAGGPPQLPTFWLRSPSGIKRTSAFQFSARGTRGGEGKWEEVGCGDSRRLRKGRVKVNLCPRSGRV